MAPGLLRRARAEWKNPQSGTTAQAPTYLPKRYDQRGRRCPAARDDGHSRCCCGVFLAYATTVSGRTSTFAIICEIHDWSFVLPPRRRSIHAIPRGKRRDVQRAPGVPDEIRFWIPPNPSRCRRTPAQVASAVMNTVGIAIANQTVREVSLPGLKIPQMNDDADAMPLISAQPQIKIARPRRPSAMRCTPGTRNSPREN